MLVFLYSKFSAKSIELIGLAKKIPEMGVLCVDSKKIRNLLLASPQIKVTEVPAVIEITNGVAKVYQGAKAGEWVSDVLSQLESMRSRGMEDQYAQRRAPPGYRPDEGYGPPPGPPGPPGPPQRPPGPQQRPPPPPMQRGQPPPTRVEDLPPDDGEDEPSQNPLYRTDPNLPVPPRPPTQPGQYVPQTLLPKEKRPPQLTSAPIPTGQSTEFDGMSLAQKRAAMLGEGNGAQTEMKPRSTGMDLIKEAATRMAEEREDLDLTPQEMAMRSMAQPEAMAQPSRVPQGKPKHYPATRRQQSQIEEIM